MDTFKNEQPYTKPIGKTTLTVRFISDDFDYVMELPNVPRIGEFFKVHSGMPVEIKKVTYLVTNQYLADVEVSG